MDIAGSIALVAGGASGAGLAVTSALHDAGASVVVLDLPGSDGAAVAAALGPRAMFSAGDASSPEDVDAALDAAGALAGGVPRIVVCGTAGTGVAGSGAARTAVARTVEAAGPFPLEEFTRAIQAGLIGTFNLIRLAADRMSRAGPAGGELSGQPGGQLGGQLGGQPDAERGVIVTTASAAAFDGQAGQVAYAAAAAGIAGLTLPVARDLAPLGIRVMTIVPGWAGVPPGEYAALVTHIVRNPGLNGETIRLGRLSS